MWQKLGITLGCVVSIFAIIQGVDTLNSKFARAEDLRTLNEQLKHTNARLEYKIKEDQLYSVKKRLWQLEDRTRESGNKYVEEERELKHIISILESELKILTEK